MMATGQLKEKGGSPLAVPKDSQYQTIIKQLFPRLIKAGGSLKRKK